MKNEKEFTVTTYENVVVAKATTETSLLSTLLLDAEKAFLLNVKESRERAVTAAPPEEVPSKKSDPFAVYPDESKKHRFIFQIHQAAVIHGDLRFEVNDHLVGITLAIVLPNKPTPRTEEDLRKMIRENNAFKLDLKTGDFLLRQKEGGTVTFTQLFARLKEPQPKQWLNIEEATFQKSTVGATPLKPGIMLAVQKGYVEFGSVKSGRFYEYFLTPTENLIDSSWKTFRGRYILRSAEFFQLLNKRAEVLPPSEEQDLRPGEKSWAFIKAKNQLPYILSLRAIDDKFLLPVGFSGIPKYLRDKIPPGLRFWNIKDAVKRHEVRVLAAKFVKDILKEPEEDTERSLTGKFTLQHFSFAGQKLTRVGPSFAFYRLNLLLPEKNERFESEFSPLEPPVDGTLQPLRDAANATFHGDVAPNTSELNETKTMHGFVRVLDVGALEFDEGVYMFKGSKLKGQFTLTKEKGSNLWTFDKLRM